MAWHVRKNGEMRGYDFVFAIDKRDIVVECVSDNGKHIEMYVYVDNYFESNLTKALDQKQLAILRQVYKMICAWITESSAYRLQMVLGEKEISSFQTMK
jgi:uncharacterized protein YukJ